MKRFLSPGASVVLCLALASCGGDPGDEAAQGACHGYAETAANAADAAEPRTTALARAQRAGEANNSYEALQGDMQDAWSRSDAMAAAHNSGRTVSGRQLDQYMAADARVRTDCADAGTDIGRLER